MRPTYQSALLGSIFSVAFIVGAEAAVLETQTESFSGASLLTFQQYGGPGTLTGVTLGYSVSIATFGYLTSRP